MEGPSERKKTKETNSLQKNRFLRSPRPPSPLFYSRTSPSPAITSNSVQCASNRDESRWLNPISSKRGKKRKRRRRRRKGKIGSVTDTWCGARFRSSRKREATPPAFCFSLPLLPFSSLSPFYRAPFLSRHDTRLLPSTTPPWRRAVRGC